MATEYRPGDILSSLGENSALIILNRPILIEKTWFKNLWNSVNFRVIVDGGMNRYIKFMTENGLDQSLKKPDVVCGDFDSCSDESLAVAKNLGAEVIHTPDQNETDFTKSIKVVLSATANAKINSIFVLEETSGRLDQILGNINTLYRVKELYSPDADRITIYMISSSSISWLLESGKHKIYIPEHVLKKKLWCALIPIGGKSLVTTEGLKWNLSNQYLEYGGIVSSSNTYDDDSGAQIVEVNTENTILWSMGIDNED